MFKTPVMRKSYPQLVSEEPPPPKRGRSSEDFLMFCKMILDYENYDERSSDDIRWRHSSSPMGSTASGESSLSSFTEDTDSHDTTVPGVPTGHNNVSDEDTATDGLDDIDDDEEEITCYCKKPYGGRPMIECTSCQTWVHLTCAKVKRTQIPDIWFCALCKTKSTKVGSGKSRARKSLQSRRRKSLSSSSLSPPSSTISTSASIFKSSSKRKL